MEIKDKSVIVTGGASGLGAATCRSLSRAGGKVAIIDINKVEGEKIAKEINGLFIPCDIANENEVNEALIKIDHHQGKASILVNCAGIGTSGRIVGKNGVLPLEVFERTIRVNLIGSFNMMRLVANQIISADSNEEENGIIISTSSIAAFEGQIGQAAYAASKGGIVSMTLPAAREFAQFGIRVLTIAPGLFQTPLLAELPEEAQEKIAASIPFPKRLGEAEEFASLVIHLIENSYMNGEVIRIDGAMRLQPR